MHLSHISVMKCSPRPGSGVVRIDLLRFLAGCRKRRLNQALSVLSLSTIFLSVLLLFIRATFCVPLVCLLDVLVKLSVLAKWLAREKLLWGRLCLVRRLSPQSPGRKALTTFPFLCLVSLFHSVFVMTPDLRDIFHTTVAQYSQFVLKVPLNSFRLNTYTLHTPF